MASGENEDATAMLLSGTSVYVHTTHRFFVVVSSPHALPRLLRMEMIPKNDRAPTHQKNIHTKPKSPSERPGFSKWRMNYDISCALSLLRDQDSRHTLEDYTLQ